MRSVIAAPLKKIPKKDPGIVNIMENPDNVDDNLEKNSGKSGQGRVRLVQVSRSAPSGPGTLQMFQHVILLKNRTYKLTACNRRLYRWCHS